MAVPFAPGSLQPAGSFWNVHAFPWVRLCAVRWLCLAFVMVDQQTDGDFRWISRHGGTHAFVLLGGHAVMGFLSLACLATVDRAVVDAVSPALHRLIVLTVVGVPLGVIGLLAVRQRRDDLG